MAEHCYNVPAASAAAAARFFAEASLAWFAAVAAGDVDAVAVLLDEYPQLADARDEVRLFSRWRLHVCASPRAQFGRHALHVALAHGRANVAVYLAAVPVGGEAPRIVFDPYDSVRMSRIARY